MSAQPRVHHGRGRLHHKFDYAVASLRTEWSAALVLRRAGLIPPWRTWGRGIGVLRRSGVAGMADVFALRSPHKPAVIDSEGVLSYAELAASAHHWTNALHAQLPSGRQPTIGLMCRNSRFLMIALLGAVGIGARIVFLNTDLGPRQLAAVCQREGVTMVIHDAEFTPALGDIAATITRVVADDEVTRDSVWMASPMDAAPQRPPSRPRHRPDLVILTSGSTGTPKGASRGSGDTKSLATVAGLLERIPLRGTDRIFLAPPAFHGWGLIVSMLALAMGATLVFDRRFDADRTARMISLHDCTALIAVPTMLQRLMDTDADTVGSLARRLRIVASGGARLNPELVADVQHRLGAVLHNLYGSTETSYISIATPQELAADPTSAGTPALGVDVVIVRDGVPAASGESGEIYVRTSAQISQYTDGGAKDTMDGLMRTGDIGRLDGHGRLIVEGRADGMIVSGGENVFPEAVELTLQRHPIVADAKVISTEDAEFGQTLLALLVTRTDTADIDMLRRHVADELSRSSVPRRFVLVPELPRTSTGKVTRATVQELLAAHDKGAVS